MRNPQPDDYMEILSRSKNIARWSFSPELDGAPEFAAELSKRGIIASVGHTNASFEQCDAAYKSGSSLITHFYSCISSITRNQGYRTAGVMEYGYYQDGMSVEIIADRKCSLEAGKDADIVIFGDNVEVFATIVGGRKVYQA